ncbi:PQQ-binding-like beta-propeller repeat protein [Dactylosporangium sp. AC04546]|uniref:outer membrane protein assembly factor BamB family protein n=1 Tax=Dactylosporangium sp. AC04546 TaxID=2862460 RepID=UPI001EE0038F|nr:PQQ-binding-like beta-propeller repeat protein [Dactylosporangium sp. AC04546]WVK85428.1 PQQ-binding-like beta-propeller repeat protein [Dactylosporangium sp. AC04546]
MMIELDLSTPWEPPAPPRQRRRWPLAVLVVLAAFASLAAAVPQQGATPAFEVEHNVLSVDGAGGRVFAGRFGSVGGDPRLTAYRLRDGAELWTVPISTRQHFAYVDAEVVALDTAWEEGGGPSSTVVVLDAATGERLWERDFVQVIGHYGSLVIIEDLEEAKGFPWPGYDPDQDPAVNPTPAVRPLRYRGIDERTGGVAWTVDVPAGSLAEIGWAGAGYRLGGFSELDPSGVLRRRDLATGAVTDTYQLRFSGTLSSYTAGGERVVVYLAGRRGADVFDRTSGERLWHWEGDQFDWLFACGPDRFCAGGESGLDMLEARTGRPLWHLERYVNFQGYAGDSLLMGTYQQPSPDHPEIVVVDPDTGTVQRAIAGWRVLRADGDRLVAWRAIGPYRALLATIDPATGEVTIFGQPDEWYGDPDCMVTDGSLACVVVGRLSVWRLPPEPAG